MSAECLAQQVASNDGLTDVELVASVQASLVANLLRIRTAYTESIETMWTLLAAFVAFLILAGLALIQVAISRSSSDNVLFKHGVGICVSALTWIFGYALALGEGHLFIGGTGFDYTSLRYDDVLYRWMFAVITCSIVGGALEGRIRDSAYIVFTLVCSLLIHAVPAHWIWTDIGWLRVIGAIDLAGCASVHVVAGMAVLVGSLLLGPRVGRWRAPQAELVGVPGSRMPSYGAGTLIVWFGWFGLVTAASRFVGGLASAKVGANAAVNVALGGAAGGVVAALLTRVFCKRRDWDLGSACNGIMAGLVSVSAGGHVIPPWAAIVSGVVAALVYWGSARLVKYLQIDDATEAISVHLSAGLWGLMTVGFFADPLLMARATVPDGGDASQVLSGFVLGGNGVLIGVQVLQFLCAACWSAVLSALTFLFLSLIGRLRLKEGDVLATRFVLPGASTAAKARSGPGAASMQTVGDATDDDEGSGEYDYEYIVIDSEGDEKVLRTRPSTSKKPSHANKAKKGDDATGDDSDIYTYEYCYEDSQGRVIETKPRKKDAADGKGDKKSSSSASSSSASSSSSKKHSATGEYSSSSGYSSDEEDESGSSSSGSGSGSSGDDEDEESGSTETSGTGDDDEDGEDDDDEGEESSSGEDEGENSSSEASSSSSEKPPQKKKNK